MKWESLAPSTPYGIRNFVVSLAVVALLISCTGWAQTPSVAGVVGDPSGAVISFANVVAESSEHSWRKQCTTGEDGSFSFPVPAPGHYQLCGVEPGALCFRHASQLRRELQLAAPHQQSPPPR